MIKLTYFVHGTTIDNEQHIATGWAQGELSELGIEQAKEWALMWSISHLIEGRRQPTKPQVR